MRYQPIATQELVPRLRLRMCYCYCCTDLHDELCAFRQYRVLCVVHVHDRLDDSVIPDDERRSEVYSTPQKRRMVVGFIAPGSEVQSRLSAVIRVKEPTNVSVPVNLSQLLPPTIGSILGH